MIYRRTITGAEVMACGSIAEVKALRALKVGEMLVESGAAADGIIDLPVHEHQDWEKYTLTLAIKWPQEED